MDESRNSVNSSISRDNQYAANIAQYPGSVNQTVGYTGTSATSNYSSVSGYQSNITQGELSGINQSGTISGSGISQGLSGVNQGLTGTGSRYQSGTTYTGSSLNQTGTYQQGSTLSGQTGIYQQGNQPVSYGTTGSTIGSTGVTNQGGFQSSYQSSTYNRPGTSPNTSNQDPNQSASFGYKYEKR
jgi:hypothetical protein